MWRYRQSTGELSNPQGQCVARGYSGFGIGRNNPLMQAVKDVGPCPRGIYDVGKPFNSKDHGEYCLPLIPRPENEMHGRADFLMHGDKIGHVGEYVASHGCIIQSKIIRVLVGTSDDRVIEVVE